VPSLKIFEKSMHVLYLYVSFVMSPNPIPCINANMHEFLSGLSHHLVPKKTNPKNGRAKMHAKLLCQMDR
jgi:hypothetical protein